MRWSIAIALGAACSVSQPASPPDPAPVAASIAPSAAPAPTPPPAPPPSVARRSDADPGPGMGRFELTYYWIAVENDHPRGEDTHLYDSLCFPIATTPAEFARALSIEGTGLLADGRLVNFDSRCICNWPPCLVVLGEDRPWGLGVDYRPLIPFRSVAADPRVMPTGQTLYAPELDGLEMPGEPPYGGFVHDGCLVADDRGSAILGLQIDFFVGWKSHYKQLLADARLKQVTLFEGGERCR